MSLSAFGSTDVVTISLSSRENVSNKNETYFFFPLMSFSTFLIIVFYLPLGAFGSRRNMRRLLCLLLINYSAFAAGNGWKSSR